MKLPFQNKIIAVSGESGKRQSTGGRQPGGTTRRPESRASVLDCGAPAPLCQINASQMDYRQATYQFGFSPKPKRLSIASQEFHGPDTLFAFSTTSIFWMTPLEGKLRWCITSNAKLSAKISSGWMM